MKRCLQSFSQIDFTISRNLKSALLRNHYIAANNILSVSSYSVSKRLAETNSGVVTVGISQ